MRTIATISKEYNLLNIEDIEEALSAHVGESVSISNVYCELTYFMPLDGKLISQTPITLTFYGDEDGDEDGVYFDGVFSFDLFQNEKGEPNYWKGKLLAINEPYLPVDLLFNFDVSAFAGFEIEYLLEYD